ncbi:MAG: quinolinate synthase NadA [Bacteroidetes bacterium]|nr:quinolinate synthase NadA [Bacteroidota bacterium]
MEKTELIAEINRLRKEKNAVILAHYYQEEDIQDIANFVGDSLALAKKAAETNADIIVFSGVHFMAETAKIINPNKKVVLPDMRAGCSLADGCPPDAFRKFKEQYPGHVVVTYINCSAEIKTMSDWVCTSSNAKKIINAIPKEQPVIFAPDQNLGKYLMQETGRDMVLWKGSCVVHEAFSIEKLLDLISKYPNAKVAAHPESQTHILKIADFIGSTAGILNYIKTTNETDTFIIATEAGILHKMAQDNPNKVLIPAPVDEDNTCACSECAFMKLNTLEKLYRCLRDETPEIILEKELIEKALVPIERMLSFS